MKTSPRITRASLIALALSACVQDVNVGDLDGARGDASPAPDSTAPRPDASAPDASAEASVDANAPDASAFDVIDASPDVPSRPDASWPDAIVADVGPVMPGVESAQTTLTGNLTRAVYASNDRTMFAWLAIGGRSERDLYAIDTMTGTANQLLSGASIETSTTAHPALGDRVVRYSTTRTVGTATGWVSVFFDTTTRREIVAGAPQDFGTPGFVHDNALYVAVSTAAEAAEDTPFGTRYRYRRQLRRYALDTGAMTGSYDLPWGFFDSFKIWQRQGSTLYLAPAWQCPIMPGASCGARIDPAPFVRVDLSTMTPSSISTLPSGAATVQGSSATELFVSRERALYARDAVASTERLLLAAPSEATESSTIQVAPDASRAIVATTLNVAGTVGRLRDLQLYFPATRAMVRLPTVLGDARASVDLSAGAELAQVVYRPDQTTELWFYVRSGVTATAQVVADFDARGALLRSRGFSLSVEAPGYQSDRSSIVKSPDGLREFLLQRDTASGFVHVLSAPTGSPESAFTAITTIAADHSALGAPANDRVTFLVRDPMRGFVQLFARGL
ncbi:MAG: hypothetical protein JNK05_30730 [Myxococcales bacterium]|nr:hypothetical protein [Myxococcales bacterium]